jgi:predicted RNA-binding protein YlxR (DUF448 family)
VVKKTAKRVKHVPQRTCVGCREILAKRALVRVVRTPQGLQVDSTGKLPGRGAYLHDRRSCWERGLKGSLAHALKTELSDQDREILAAFMVTLPEEGPLPDEVDVVGSVREPPLPEPPLQKASQQDGNQMPEEREPGRKAAGKLGSNLQERDMNL